MVHAVILDLPPDTMRSGAPARTYLGDRGPAVLAWQTVLARAGLLPASGVDGIHGPRTEAASALYGEPPEHPRSLTPAERAERFGAFAFVPAPTATDPQAIRITDGWPSEHVVSAHLPQLLGIVGAPESCRVPWHRDGVRQLRSLWQAWELAGLLDRVLSWAGSWCPRMMRGSSATLSAHAWATAFDVNAAHNPMGRPPAELWARGCVRELVPLAEAHGFSWGGWWQRADGMHFELR